MADLNEFVSAFRMHDWYVVLGLLLTFVIQFVRKNPLTSPAWQKIPAGFRFLPPVVFAYAVGFVTAYTEHQPFSVALIAGLGGVFEIGMTSMGFAAALKESPLPWDGGSGGLLMLLIVLSPALTRCHSNTADRERQELAAYNAAAIVLENVDAIVSADPRLQQCGAPAADADAGAPAADAGVASDADAGAPSEPAVCHLEQSIQRARADLNILRNELVNGSTETTAEHLTNELGLVKNILDEATADGITVPPLIVSSVDTAVSLLQGR